MIADKFINLQFVCKLDRTDTREFNIIPNSMSEWLN